MKKHEFAPRWHVMNVPERYAFPDQLLMESGNVQMKYTGNGRCGGMGPSLAPEGSATAILDEVWPIHAVCLGPWAAWPPSWQGVWAALGTSSTAW